MSSEDRAKFMMRLVTVGIVGASVALPFISQAKDICPADAKATTFAERLTAVRNVCHEAASGGVAKLTTSDDDPPFSDTFRDAFKDSFDQGVPS